MFQRLAYTKYGEGIQVNGVAATPTPVHSFQDTNPVINVTLFASNPTQSDVLLTILFAGTPIVVPIPAQSGLFKIVEALPMAGSKTSAIGISAYVAAADVGKVYVHGQVDIS